MKFKAQFLKALKADDGTFELFLSTGDAGAVKALKSLSGQDISVECKKWRNPRSLDANAYMWELIGQIAGALGNDSDTIYENMLRDYGSFVTIPIWKPELENEKRKHRLCVELDETVLTDKKGNEQTFVWCKCYRGSSEYDTAEMARLIDGVVNEAKELGIDTRTPKEIEAMNQAWKAQKE